MATVGEDNTFKALDLLREKTSRPYSLCVWYDACGRGVNPDFLSHLEHYTKNIIVSHKNQFISAIWGYAILYRNYDFIIMTCPDFFVKDKWFERIMAPFENPQVAISGEAFRKMSVDFILSDFDKGIDGIVAIRKKAVNDLGGISPSFTGFGPHHTELYRRFASNGWHYAAIDGLCEHADPQHEGRDKFLSWERILEKDNAVYLAADSMGYKNYDWWRNDLSEKKCTAILTAI